MLSRHMKCVSVSLMVASALQVSCAKPPSPAEEGIAVKVVRAGFHPFTDNPYVVSASGSGVLVRPLWNKLGDEPEWSPDGAWIAFSTLFEEGGRAGGNSDVYLASRDGSVSMRLTSNPENDSSPSWSPDGKRIAYYARGDPVGVFVMELDCTLQESEPCGLSPTFLARGEAPDWAPDGNSVVLTESGNIEVVDVLTATVTQLGIRGRDPHWSPLGDRIVYQCEDDICLFDMTTMLASKVTSGDAFDSKPDWSPDGSLITFVSTRDALGTPLSGIELESNGLFVLSLNNQTFTRLTQASDELVLWYAWLP